MNIEKYQELTGITVPTAQQPIVQAQINRSRAILESMLGYTLKKSNAETNYYNELGKTTNDFILETDVDELEEPDELEGAYRLFDFVEADKFMSIDPLQQIYKVKLVYILGEQEPSGEAASGVTIKTFDPDEYRLHVGAGNIKKYLEKTDDCWWGWWDRCGCDDRRHVQLAVDAIWWDFNCLPQELQYLWTDMVQYYSDPKKDIIRQTLGSHSWSKGNVNAPQETKEALAILRKYAGPHGTVTRTITL